MYCPPLLPEDFHNEKTIRIQRNSALDSFSISHEFTAKTFLSVRQEPVKYEFEVIVRMPCWPRASTEFKFGHTVLPRKLCRNRCGHSKKYIYNGKLSLFKIY